MSAAGRRNGREGEIVSRAGGSLAALASVAVWLTAAPASAQSNLDAGKSPAQIFAHTCNACHRSPREIKKTTPAFMREHYTTGSQEAATMAAYLSQVGSDSKAVEQRKKPVLGAGREPPPGSEPKPAGDAQVATANGPGAPKPPQAGRTRRPAESFEAGIVIATSVPAAPASAPSSPAASSPSPATASPTASVPAEAPAATTPAPAVAPTPVPAATPIEE